MATLPTIPLTTYVNLAGHFRGTSQVEQVKRDSREDLGNVTQNDSFRLSLCTFIS